MARRVNDSGRKVSSRPIGASPCATPPIARVIWPAASSLPWSCIAASRTARQLWRSFFAPARGLNRISGSNSPRVCCNYVPTAWPTGAKRRTSRHKEGQFDLARQRAARARALFEIPTREANGPDSIIDVVVLQFEDAWNHNDIEAAVGLAEENDHLARSGSGRTGEVGARRNDGLGVLRARTVRPGRRHRGGNHRPSEHEAAPQAQRADSSGGPRAIARVHVARTSGF